MKLFKKIIHTDATWVLADQALYSGTNFILTLFLAKQMHIADFGLFSTVVILTYLALSFMNAILIQPFQVAVATVSNKKEYYVFLFLGLVILLVLFMFLAWIPAFFIKAKAFHFFDVAFFIVAYLFQDFFRKLFLAIGKIKWVLAIDALFLILVALGFYFSFSKINLETALNVMALSNFISGASGLFFIIKIFEFPLSWKSFLIDHVQQAKWLLSVAALQWASSNFFVLVSGIYLGIEALAALRLVQSFFGILNVVLQTVENYYIPKMASLYHENVEKAKAALLKTTAYGALIFGSMLLVLFVFASEIIVLAGGNSYEKYAFVVRIMACLYFFIFLSYPFRIMIRVMLLNKSFFIGYLLSFVVSVASFHVLLHFLGLSGAIIGLMLNQIIMLIYWQTQLKKNHFLLWK
jgi:O-antigen/teichoic acid export membrane protein